MDRSRLKYNWIWPKVVFCGLCLVLFYSPAWALEIKPQSVPLDQSPNAVQDASKVPIGDVDLDLEALLGDTPKNERLFHVGRLPRLAGAKDQTPAAAAAEDLIQDERAASDWIELEIDKDGTYLFFGDVDDAEPALLGPPEEHILPGGIGLSKKWHF